MPTHYQDGIQPILYTLYDTYGRMDKTGWVASLTATSIQQLLTDTDYKTTPGQLGFGQPYRTQTALLDAQGQPNGQFITTQTTQFDTYHRPTTTISNHPIALSNSAAVQTQTLFNDLDQPKSMTTSIQVNAQTYPQTYATTYDHSGRPFTEQFTFAGNTQTIKSNQRYDPRDQPTQCTIGSGLQTLDYTYYANGYLENINADNLATTSVNNASDLFYKHLDYDGIGNIIQTEDQFRGYSKEIVSYQYDNLQRIEAMTASNGEIATFTYRDLLGNFDRIERKKRTFQNNQWTSTWIDKLQFSYTSQKASQLHRVLDETLQTHGCIPSIQLYQYDANGNLTYDPSRRITLTNNFLNLPSSMTRTDGSRQEILYDAAGTKWQQKEYSSSGSLIKVRSYIAGFEFTNGELELLHHAYGYIQNQNIDSLVLSGAVNYNKGERASSITSTEQIETAEVNYTAGQSITLKPGFHAKAGANFHAKIAPVETDFLWTYHLTDHLGNVVARFADINNDGQIDQHTEILSLHSYFPFGMERSGNHLNQSIAATRYKYNVKEQDDFSSYYFYGARNYDNTTGRFTGVDPLADIPHSIGISSYHYVANNPINNVDPDGLDWFRNADGEEYWADRTEAQDGEESLGRFHIVEGKNGYVIHDQNKIVGTVSKADGGDREMAQVQLFSYRNVAQEIDGPVNQRQVEALAATGDLIQDALLTYSPGVKGVNTKGFSPKFNTALTKNMKIFNYKLSNHAWRKSGLGRGATKELIEDVIIKGRTSFEPGTGKFAGNIIKIYQYNGVKVAVDESRKIIMSIRPDKGFKLTN